jgi:uncharacterized membrane protein
VEKNKKCRIDVAITENDELAMEISTAIMHQIKHKINDKSSLTESKIASLSSSALKAKKLFDNVTPKTIPVPEDNEGFYRIMEMLDQMEAFKRDNPGFEFK